MATKETAVQAKTSADLELMQKQAEAQFALSPIGQMLKQFEVCQRMGQLMSQASIVPDAYKGNMPNCAVAIDMAIRMKMPPVAVMQNLYVVHGNPAWSSKFLIACITSCGRFTSLDYKMKENVAQDSDDYGCRCVAYSINDTKKENPLYGPWVTWKMVKAEGWLTKNGSKWKTMPGLMFRYRAAAFWQRLYAPELAMGINTVEEAYDMPNPQAAASIDVPFEEVKDNADEPKPVEITDKQFEEAFTDLSTCTCTADVKNVRQKHFVVYENSGMFRDAVIDLFHTIDVRVTSEPETPAPEEPNS